ncbi:hypothetical protein [Kribbella sp. NBC_00359]|uniref:hypothetical protein n=1 Tax=Kribbella sp. NBC_00359 TaxID=2975966 RepID=UPI003FA55B09
MRALGQRLGTAATAIYWHVKTKDELVQLAGDAVWTEIELSDLEAAGLADSGDGNGGRIAREAHSASVAGAGVRESPACGAGSSGPTTTIWRSTP